MHHSTDRRLSEYKYLSKSQDLEITLKCND